MINSVSEKTMRRYLTSRVRIIISLSKLARRILIDALKWDSRWSL